MNSASPVRPALRPRVRWLFRAATVCIVVALGALGGELVLRRQQRAIARSNQLDAGMVKYDPLLGWRLQPKWTGSHKHHDFSARYSISERGFRSDTPDLPRNSGRKLTIALGDSFTFGYGVNDAETFVHRLDAQAAAGFDYLNAGTPGYSTDQEMLFLEKELLALSPQRILLIVYVANDLLDNQLEVPLQLRTSKPRFEVVDDGLVLRNVPVPVNADARVQPWMPLVLGTDASQWSWRTRLDFRFELFRLASLPFPRERDYRPEFATRLAPAVNLFERLVDVMARMCAGKKAELVVVLLAGSSHLQASRSPSAQYQEFFCEHIVERLEAKAIPVIHLSDLLKARSHRQSGKWFFPHDGHLTVAGHEAVAEILAGELEKVRFPSTR